MIRLRTLGESVIEVGEHRVGPEAAALFGLLLYLSVERGKRVPRSVLVETFWPDAGGADRARHCLRQTLYKLRLLGADLVATASDVELSAAQVRADFLDLAAGEPLDAQCLRLGGAAFGDFLPGYAPSFSPFFDDWLERQRDHAHAIVRRALSDALLESRALQRWADVDAVARHCLRLDPLNEEATLALAEATALTGSKAQALSLLDRYIGELGPGAADVRLPAAILRRRIAERLPNRRYSAASEACFVGREESMEFLAALLRDVRGGVGRACLIWGEAGIGKSRLVAECADAASLQGFQIARVGCQASDVRRPLSAFVDLVPALLALPGALGCSPTSMRYLRRLTEHDASAAPTEETRDAEFLFARVRHSLFDLVDAVAGENPLVVVVEDVHWLDQVSWEVAREMIDWASSRRVLFLFTSRTEQAPGAPEAAPTLRLARHRLPAISDDAAGALLDAVVREGGREIDAEFREWCVSVAEGNPLFVRELGSQWVETGDRRKVPASLAAVIEGRIDRLRPNALRVLQICALLRNNGSFERIEAVSGCTHLALVDSVEELELAGMVRSHDSGLIVRHDLVEQSVLRRLHDGTRRLLNRSIANVLSVEVATTRSASLLWDCVDHWEAAGELYRVAALVKNCAAHMIDIGLPSDAAEVFEQAAARAQSASARYEMLSGWAHALCLAGRWKRLLGVLSKVTEARYAVDPLAPAHCDDELSQIEAEWRGGTGSRQLLPRVLECVYDERADPAHRLRACGTALRFADHIGDADCASRVYSIVAELTRRADTDKRDALICSLIYHSQYGDLMQARSAAEDLISLERQFGTPATLCRALRFGWHPLIHLGEFTQAHIVAHEAYCLAERYRLSGSAVGAADDIATLYCETGNVAQAESWCSIGLSWAESADDTQVHEAIRYTRTRVSLLNGNREQARAEFPWTLASLRKDEDVRRRVDSLALWVLLFGNSCTSAELDELFAEFEQLHRRMRTASGQDFNTFCVSAALVEAGKTDEAYSLLSEYASSYRRERSPLPRYFVELRSRLIALRARATD